ncbi:hypothetical protein VN97_g319 [Penicillium thymicola]|uniref:Uncharacterized protein n=1 Tax=Penicillium thymicola TaxID=293382 RepID=A0AAI9TTR6_PENTH|nr:hypothetical protein VN97_g319 [Penicillium thymicola]
MNDADTRSRQATTYNPPELIAYRDLAENGSSDTPKLLGYKTDKQDLSGLVPGGFIIWLVWEIVPGLRLGNGNGADPFWALESYEREQVRLAFLKALPYFIAPFKKAGKPERPIMFGANWIAHFDLAKPDPSTDKPKEKARLFIPFLCLISMITCHSFAPMPNRVIIFLLFACFHCLLCLARRLGFAWFAKRSRLYQKGSPDLSFFLSFPSFPSFSFLNLSTLLLCLCFACRPGSSHSRQNSRPFPKVSRGPVIHHSDRGSTLGGTVLFCQSLYHVGLLALADS